MPKVTEAMKASLLALARKEPIPYKGLIAKNILTSLEKNGFYKKGKITPEGKKIIAEEIKVQPYHIPDKCVKIEDARGTLIGYYEEVIYPDIKPEPFYRVFCFDSEGNAHQKGESLTPDNARRYCLNQTKKTKKP